MSVSSSPTGAEDGARQRYSSLAALQAAHNDLLRRQREEGLADVSAAVLQFLRAATATGALLDSDDDRRDAQSMLDYWAARLYRIGQEPPDTALADFDLRLAPELPDELCPYLGLDAFREQDASNYFGRARLVDEMVEQLAESRLLAVVGPSGSGKSSLVRAGLVPALKAGRLAGAENWLYLDPIVPGSDPLANLERALSDTETRRHGDTDTPLPVSVSPYLLVVDQFEELFTLCEAETARRAFIARLIDLVEAPWPRHHVVLTMRSDFEPFIARVPELLSLFEDGRVQVTPLSAAELREAIGRPAEAVGLNFENGVVDLLLQDILGEPAGLPLLQFTLLKLWEHRDRNRVTRAIYDRVGGGRLALARCADELYAGLIPEEQVTARRILLRLVRPGEGLEITSSRVRRAELFRGGEDPGRVDRVLAKLVSAHLLRLTEGETPADAQVEVAHEALVRNWPTLVDWLEEEKSALATRRRLEGRAAEWTRLGQGAGGLLDEVELREAERWLQSPEAAYLGFDPALPTLVAASRRAIDRRARRIARLRLALIVVSLAAALLGFGLAIFAFQQRQVAVRNEQVALQNSYAAATAEARAQQDAQLARTAEAQSQQQRSIAEQQTNALATAQAQVREQLVSVQLATTARDQAPGSPEVALLLASEAALHDRNPVTEQALRETLEQLRASLLYPSTSNDPTVDALFSPDGRRVLTVAASGAARLWDLAGKQIAAFPGHNYASTQAVFSPDGQRLLITYGTTGELWDPSGRLLASLLGHTEHINVASFSPDGRSILTASSDDTVRLWNLNGEQIGLLRGQQGDVTSAVFSPDSRQILTASFQEGNARLWDLGGHQIRTFPVDTIFRGVTSKENSAVFSPDGQKILTSSTQGTIRLWSLGGEILATFKGEAATFSPDGKYIVSGKELRDLSGKLVKSFPSVIVFSPDGQRLLFVNQGIVVRDSVGETVAYLPELQYTKSARLSPDNRYVLTSDGRLWDLDDNLLPGFFGTDAAFSPDGRLLAVVLGSGQVQLWDVNRKQLAVFSGHKDTVFGAVFSPDGQSVLTASKDGTARLWDLGGRTRAIFQGHTGAVFRALFSPDGRRVLTMSDDNTVRLWDLDGRQLAVLGGNSGVFSPDGQRILTHSSVEHASQLWDLSGKKVADLPFAGELFSPDGQRILSWAEDSGDYGAHLWSADGQKVAEFRHDIFVSAAAFSPDGSRVATATWSGLAYLWDTNGRQLAVFKGHASLISSIVFSPDGQRVLTASRDGTARLWDLNGHQIVILNAATGALARAFFSPDGRRILTIPQLGSIHLQFTRMDDMLAIAECRVGRGLTDEEINRFQVPTPLKFDFSKRSCPAVLGS